MFSRPAHTPASQAVPRRSNVPAGKPVNVLGICIELRITKLSPKKFFAVAKRVEL